MVYRTLVFSLYHIFYYLQSENENSHNGNMISFKFIFRIFVYIWGAFTPAGKVSKYMSSSTLGTSVDSNCKCTGPKEPSCLLGEHN